MVQVAESFHNQQQHPVNYCDPLVDGLDNVKISSFTNEMRSCDFRRFGG